METLEARISELENEINGYKAKLNGAATEKEMDRFTDLIKISRETLNRLLDEKRAQSAGFASTSAAPRLTAGALNNTSREPVSGLPLAIRTVDELFSIPLECSVMTFRIFAQPKLIRHKFGDAILQVRNYGGFIKREHADYCEVMLVLSKRDDEADFLPALQIAKRLGTVYRADVVVTLSSRSNEHLQWLDKRFKVVKRMEEPAGYSDEVGGVSYENASSVHSRH